MRAVFKAAILAACVTFSVCAYADTTKDNNSTALNLGTSWIGGVVPGAGDVAIFDGTLTLSTFANGTTPAPLGGDLSLAGILVAGPVLGQLNSQNGIVISNAGSTNTLTLGAAGIDMSAANAVPLQMQPKIKLAANQTWNISDASANITNPATGAGSKTSPFGQTHDEDLLLFNQNATAGVATIDLGGFALTKTGNGTVEFNAGWLITNGIINLNQGILTAQGGSSRNTTINSSTTINVNNGAILRFQSNGNASLFNNGIINLNDGSLMQLTTTNATNNHVVIGGVININGATIIDVCNQPVSGTSQGSAGNPDDISGNLVGAGPLSLRHTNTNANMVFQLSGDNSGYTGTATLDAPSGNRFVRMTSNTAGSAAATWVVTSGNTLQVAGNIAVQLGTLNGDGTINNPTAAATSTINVGAGNFSGTLQNNAGTGGTLALTKVGAGTLTLSGSNSYTGATTIANGTLKLGSDAALPAGSTPILGSGATSGTLDLAGFSPTVAGLSTSGTGVNNIIGNSSATTPSTLTYAGGASTYAGSIVNTLPGGTQTVGLTVSSGLLTLGGANQYTGSTNVNGGTLSVTGSLASSANVVVNGGGTLSGASVSGSAGRVGNVTLQSGGSLRPGATSADGSAGTLTLSSLTVNGGDLRFDLSVVAASDKIAVTGAANFAAASTLSPAAAPPPGTYTLLTAGTLNGTAPTLSTPPAGTTRTSYALNFDTAANRIQLTVAGSPKNLTWTGTNGSAWDLTSTVNWSDNGGAVANEKFFNLDTVTFGTGPSNRNVTLNTTVTPTAVTVNNASGNDYTISGSGGIGDNGFVGGTPLTKTGTGTLTLGTTNTYLGATSVQVGTLRLGAAGALPAGTTLTLGSAGNSSTVDLAGFNATVGSLATSGAGTTNLIGSSGGSPVTLTVTGGVTTFAGAIADTLPGGSSTVGLTLTGGTLTLAGNNNYSGPTIINPGATLQVGAGGAAGRLGTTAITDDGTLIFNRSGDFTHSGAINGQGSLQQIGAGALTLAADNAYAGATTIAGGSTLQIGSGATAGSLGAGDVANDGILAFNRSDDILVTNVISGAGAVQHLGAGTTTFGVANSYSGGLTVNKGTVRETVVRAAGTGLSTVNTGGTLVLNGALTFTNPITMAGGTLGSSGSPTAFSSADFTAAAGTTSTVYISDPQALGTNSEMILTGTLHGSGNLNVLAGDSNPSPDGGVGFRLRGTALSDFSGTITLGNSVKGELQTTVPGPYSPGGTGKWVLTAGTFTTGTVQGNYTELNLRNNTGATGGNTILGNDVEVTGTGIVTLNPLGSAPAGSVSTLGNLRIGDGQTLGVNKNGTPSYTAAFQSVTLTVGNATFSPKTIDFGFTGSADLILGAIGESAPGSGIIMSGQATLTITGPGTYTGPTAVQNGTMRVTGSVAGSSGVTVSPGAAFDAAASQTVKTLTINSGAKATVSAGVLKVGDNTKPAPLTIDSAGGTLDLTSRALVVDYQTPGSPAAALTAVRSQIISGFNAGTWIGPGINSSTAALDPNSKGVGYAQATEVAPGGTFQGASVDTTAVIARYTLLGDATLDGAVDFNDLVQLAQNYNTQVSASSASWWFRGDFTYDGMTDFNDLVKLAQNYNTSRPPPAIPGASADFNQDLARAFASVPEPGCGLLLAAAAAGWFSAARRRR